MTPFNMAVKKFYVIFSETRGGYWNRVTKKIKGLDHATQFEGGSIQNIENIIMNDPDLQKRIGCYSIKTIYKIYDENKN